MDVEPSYLKLFRSGELAARVKEAYDRLTSCDLCPLRCGANRAAGEEGACLKGAMEIAWSMVRVRGIEPFLVGKRGAGEVTFSGCHLHCIYCVIKPYASFGRQINPAELAELMLTFQERGCHNLQLVSPTHFVPHILEALEIAVSRGFRLPLVYNTSGYESLDTLKLLEGIVDIYLPDLKYGDPEVAKRYSGVEDYPRITQEAIREMYRQVGDLVLDEEGVAVRGLVVRHLVLPKGVNSHFDLAQPLPIFAD
ncbi:putative pyruvate formate lyase activating enzyme [Desulfofundulus australicus DSM 11792]|uniref:Putative pyruvate formate lyase activating enzyme n=1 Tax=Desulfofundulus australicus DSM 11792 TaxID=1121425 RepID=A0A1M5DV41_9FIRM|nr:radical SAM protein [Desulfofundulus australicus]SHF70805.1 putative pyruvate formate lyase activating enzyme [Desulfofundulus australicus DSM 11792]